MKKIIENKAKKGLKKCSKKRSKKRSNNDKISRFVKKQNKIIKKEKKNGELSEIEKITVILAFTFL